MDNGLINIICIAYPTSLQSFDLNRGSTQKKEIQKNKSQNRNEKLQTLPLGLVNHYRLTDSTFTAQQC